MYTAIRSNASIAYYLVDKAKLNTEILSNKEAAKIKYMSFADNINFRDNSVRYTFYTMNLRGNKIYINPPSKPQIAKYDLISNKHMVEVLNEMYNTAKLIEEDSDKLEPKFIRQLESYTEHTQIRFLSESKENDPIVEIHTYHFDPPHKIKTDYKK